MTFPIGDNLIGNEIPGQPGVLSAFSENDLGMVNARRNFLFNKDLDLGRPEDASYVPFAPDVSQSMMSSGSNSGRGIPTATSDSVEEIIEAGHNYFKKTGRRVTFEYALMDGVNDSREIANELAELLRGNGSHVNLIPINPTAGDFKRPSKSRVFEFKRILSEAGVNCTIRIEKGTEISAACGQLRTDIVG